LKYMLMIYNRPDFVEQLSDAERTELFAEVDAIMQELSDSGELLGGQALAPGARTARLAEGAPHVTDGPFVESKEQFAGYVSVECATDERAAEIATRWPDVRFGGAIEIRAILADSGAEA
jgi:hypothetical protein